MNIEALIETAKLNLAFSLGTGEPEEAQQAATVASAAALTAIAVIPAQMTTTGENVTTGETIRWLRVDTGA